MEMLASWASPFLFFLVSVAYKMPWTALSSLLTQFSKEFGPEVLLYLNVAYFFPSIPVLVLQSAVHSQLEAYLGPARSYLWRLTVGLGGLVLMSASLPLWAGQLGSLVTATGIIGMAYGLAFGTSYQLVAKFGSSSTVALTTGFVSCGPIVLLFDVFLKRGPFYPPQALQTFFKLVALQVVVGLAAAVYLVGSQWRELGSKDQLHTHMKHLGRQQDTIKGALGAMEDYQDKSGEGAHWGHHNQEHDVGTGSPRPRVPNVSSHQATSSNCLHMTQLQRLSHHSSKGSSPGGSPRWNQDRVSIIEVLHEEEKKRELGQWSLLLTISPAAWSIFLSVGTSMMVFPFFTYVTSTGLWADQLPQVLFYIRLCGDILGRLVPGSLQTRNVRVLLTWALVKGLMTPLLMAALVVPDWVMGDLGIAVTVGIFWTLSGYVNTCAYLVAQRLVPPPLQSRAGGLMATVFQTSCFLGLVAAYVIQVVCL